MPTPRGWGLLAAALGASFGSRLVGSSELAIAAQAAVLLVLLSVAATWLLSAVIDVRRHVIPRRLFYDAEGTVELHLRNLGRLPTPILQVVDPAPSVLAAANRFVVSPLRYGRTVVLRYRLHARQRGVFALGPTRLLLRDPFGLAARRVTLSNEEKVVVYPPVWRLPPGLPLGSALTATNGRTRPAAHGDELAGVRKYVRGDDLRQVHWRTTARRGELFVRQNEAPWAPRGTVLLDTRTSSHGGVGAAASIEAAVAAAASSVHHLTDRGLAVQLATEPDDLRRSEMPWELTLERLAQVTLRRDVDFDGLLQRLARAHGLGTLVAIVGIPSMIELRALVRAGRGFGLRAAMLVDGASFGRTGQDPEAAAAAEAALRRANWRVAVLAGGDRIDHVWARLAAQRPGAARIAQPPTGRPRTEVAT